MELATLQIAIDSRQTKTAKEWLDDLTRSGERAEKAMGGVGAGGRTAAAGNTAAAASARSATDALNQQEAAARRLTATIRHYASIVFGAFSAREIIRMADDWGQYASRLRIATEQSGDFIQVQQRMLDISNRVYKSFGDSAEMYIRTAKALQELGYSSKQAGDLVETLQYSLTVSAADSQKSAAVIDALSKSILTGKVAMDQFNTIVAYNPRLQQAMADAITKGSLSALQKMVADGKLTVSQLMKVTSEMERMGQEADRMPVTMEDAVQRMNNKLTAFFGRVNESTGAVNVLTDAVDGLGDALDRIDISAVARDFAVLSDTWELISEKATQVLDAVEEFGGNFESMLFSSENGVRVLGNSIVTSFEQSFLNTAKEVDALYDVFAGVLASLGSGFKTLGENIVAALKWAFEWGKYYAQTIVFEFEQAMVAVGWMDGSTIKVPELPERAPFFKDLRVEADKAREAIEGTLGAHAALSHRIGDNGIWRAAVVAMDAYSGGAVKATGANTRLTQELDKGKKALTEAEKAQQAFEKQRRQYLNGLYGEISALQDQARGLEDQIALYGLAESAKYDLAIADLEAQKAALAVIDAGAEEIAILERKIELLHQMRGSQQTLERLDAEKQAWETWSRDVEQIFQQVGQSLTDAIFEGGKSGRDLIKDLFKTLTLRVLIQPVMSGLQGLFMGAGPAGVANAGGAAGSMMGSPTSLFSMFGGNSMGMGMSNVMSHLSTSSMLQGTGVGNWLMGQAGNVAGMSNLALGGAGLLGGLGANLIFGGKGHSGIGGGLGSTLGMALGGPLGAVAGTLIGGGLGSLFGDREPTTRREQRTQVEYAGGLFDVTKVDDRAPAGADAAARALAEQAVQTANDIFKQVGVDAAIDSFHAIMASSYAGDRDGVASGGQLRIGDEYRQFGIANEGNPTIQGFGGWSSAETLPRLATDIQLSVLEAFQSLSDQLPNVLASMLEGIDIRSLGEQEAQALVERFASITQGATQFLAAVDQMPFEQLRDLSFDAAAAMVQFAGGIDGLIASQQTYYERFYSDAERHGHAIDQLTQALAGVGVEMPALTGSTDDMLASYRALVESLDLTTEAGQQAYVTLMQTAGAFADVAQFAGQAAEAQRRGIESAYQAVVQAGQAEIAKLQESFAGTDAAMSAYRSKVQGYIDGFNSLFSAIDQGIKALRGTGEAFEADYARARAVISTALVTGQLPQTVDLTDVLRTAQQGVTGRTYVSQAEQERAYAILANELEGLREIAAPELDTAQATLNQLEEQYALLRGTNRIAGDSLLQLEEQVRLAFAAEDAARQQIAAIESQTEAYRMQVSAITGLGSSVLSLSGAMTALAEALKLEVGAGQGGHVAYLSGNPDLMAAWMAQGGESSMSAAEWAQYHWDNYGKYEDRPFGLPSFDVGINRVPRDMLARIHKDEAVVPAKLNPFNPGAMTWGGGDQEMKSLLREVIDRLDRLHGPVLRTASATEKTADLTDQVTEGGNATRTVSMEIVDVRVTA